MEGTVTIKIEEYDKPREIKDKHYELVQNVKDKAKLKTRVSRFWLVFFISVPISLITNILI